MDTVSLLLLFLYQSVNGKNYHALVIIKENLCAVPSYKGPLVECKLDHVTETVNSYQEVDCNQDECVCQYRADSFTQQCVFNASDTVIRKCEGFERNCTLYNQVNGGVALCKERYGSCEIVSTPPLTRFSDGIPRSNPAICYPGFRAAKNKCNSTSTSCEGVVEFSISNTGETSWELCENTCIKEETACTNYTKTCDESVTHWERRFDHSEVTEECDVKTRKCIEERSLKFVPYNGSILKHSRKPKTITPVLIKNYDCSVTTNLSESQAFCAESISNNMNYKADCRLYGVELTEYFFQQMYTATTSLQDVTQYIRKKWDIIQELCKLDCFRTLTREMRYCVSDLPVQNILPGITHAQLQYIMYRSEDLLCASVSEKAIPESCIVYLDKEGSLYNKVVANLSTACSSEVAQWDSRSTMSCSVKCYNYLLDKVAERTSKPGCCLSDLVKFRSETKPWMELLSRDIFTGNLLLALVDKCDIQDKLLSCTERDSMHPAVIFVIAVIGIFSAVLTVGIVTFIAVFYRQMEYEGYKKGGLINKFINVESGMSC